MEGYGFWWVGDEDVYTASAGRLAEEGDTRWISTQGSNVALNPVQSESLVKETILWSV